MINKIFIKTTLFIIVVFISGGCAVKYGCKAPEGISCKSITEVYTDTVHKEKNQETLATQPDLKVKDENKEEGKEQLTASDQSSNRMTNSPPVPEVSVPTSSSKNTPQIISPKVLRIWIAPWEDNEGDLHEPGYIYMQTDKGKWIWQSR